MKSKSKTFLLLTHRDIEILKSLWKWKLGTTASIGLEFFGNADSDAAYQRLRRLKKFGYIQLLPIPSTQGYVWILSHKGYGEIKSFLPALREDGFLSETLHHDYWCMAFQRGPLASLSSEVEVISEQELRRLHKTSFPDWVPLSDVHRPDGYFRVPVNGKRASVALEVELNRKKDSAYYLVAHFYQNLPSIFRVIWVTQTSNDAKLIQDKIKSALPNHFQKHLFVTIPDFKEKMWQAPILLGREESKPISVLLKRDHSLVPLYRETPPVLDTRKRPYITKVYLASRKLPFRDRIAISAIPYNPQTERTNHENNTSHNPHLISTLSMFEPKECSINQRSTALTH